jgi:hypothetical protein
MYDGGVFAEEFANPFVSVWYSGGKKNKKAKVPQTVSLSTDLHPGRFALASSLGTDRQVNNLSDWGPVFTHMVQVRMNEGYVFAGEFERYFVSIRYRGGKKNKTHRRCFGSEGQGK